MAPSAKVLQIAEVRNYFTEHKKKYDDQMVKVEASKQSIGLSRGPAFLFGGGEIPQQSELLSRLPHRDAVDKLVVRYFNDYDPAIREWKALPRGHILIDNSRYTTSAVVAQSSA